MQPSSNEPATREMRYRVLRNRMPKIPPEKMTAEQSAAAAEMESGVRGYFTGSYVPILRSPALMRRLHKVGEYVRYECQLDRGINELTALVTARQWTQQYEWEAHCRAGTKCGLGQEIMQAISEGRRPATMSDREAAAYDFLVELFTNKSVSDPTYERAVTEFGEAGIIDMLGIAGYYTTLAMVMNVDRTPPPRGDILPLLPMPQQLRHVT